MQLVGPLSRPSTPAALDGLDSDEGVEHALGIVDVGRAHDDRERNAMVVDHKMALRALFAAVRWALARFLPPSGAGTVPESSAARSQSMRSAWASSSSSTWWSRCQTPAWYQSLKRRQQVIPLPHLTFRGRYF